MTMTKNELKTLNSYLDSSKCYLEFGAGESTIYASKSQTIESVDSVESSQEFIDNVLSHNEHIARALALNKLSFHVVEIGETIKWGYPKDDSQKHLWPNYSSIVFCQNKNFDLALIDGRFRVACTLNCLLKTPESCIIIIHDFWNRPQYHVVLKYLNIIDKVDSLGVFTKRLDLNLNKIKSLIRTYQYIPNDKTTLFKIRKRLTRLAGA